MSCCRSGCCRRVRRFVLFVLLVGGAIAAAEVWRRRTAGPGPGPSPDTSPSPGTTRPQPAARVDVATPPVPKPAATTEPTAAASATRWVAPVDGQCPAGYPVKANDNSGIYHVVGGRFYDRTVPERCYANAEDAEADGYRRAKA